jgi:hypothetical protein
LTESFDDVLKRPSSPPSHNLAKAVDDQQDVQPLVEAVADREAVSTSTNNTRRRRINHDQSNVLLTPPLTPSSSIRTAGSVDSNVNYNASVDSTSSNLQRSAREEEIGFTDPDTISTRFLLVCDSDP